MKELAGRLAALDPDAGAAMQVITYFDRLLEGRAGLAALVRGAAVLTGHPVRLADEPHRVFVRVDAEGRRMDGGGLPDPAWPSAPLEPDGPPALWLERPGPAGVVEAMVLERASAAIRTVLVRTRGWAHEAAPDQAMTEVLLDAAAPRGARLRAARRLGLDVAGRARAVALAGGAARVQAVDATRPDAVDAGDERAGIGPAVPVADLPESLAAARTALRFTAEGTDRDPGPRVVHADRLGGLAVLASAVGPDTEPVPDVRALERAVAAAPWMLVTLDAVATGSSLRAAAAAINVHHSTLQDRLAGAEHELGWSVHDPQGRLRLQLALALRRLHRTA
ncbi:PucR C-terminal helix-turn-helix domain-containing protein [Thermomonospora echinospora]|uniref:PucR C-terminal helix-turn-helix domain-containing protein n=1 Tax=Thermomonospora echinospora TaxID=1992 RepID=A0A1H6DAJ8_9ACTN|nr:helix-turn-helix domain-containing protein [Thermomonospora echinospora]SEG82351.1 PucR C-terminal helix-turn-helix domain-containing protein [Thermomonospora echinospora]